MKIGIMSDLHVDLNNNGKEEVIKCLCRIMREHKVEKMLIAGDIANNYLVTLDTLTDIENRTGATCLFVPGNHDLWNTKHQEKNAWQIYQALQAFPGNLSREPHILNDEWVVIGDAGWYDFSLGAENFSETDFENMEYNGMLWTDKVFVHWNRPTREVAQFFYDKLKAQLEMYSEKQIIFLTHVIPHAEFTVKGYKEFWGYFNAFLGSSAYGELVMNYPVQYVVFGHVHHRRKKVINGKTFICNSLGYTREWYNPTNPYEEIMQIFTTIEI